MHNAEMVTFGGGGLVRAAHLRGDTSVMLADPRACVVLSWRGRLLFSGDVDLVRLAPGHPVLADAGGAALFLGLDGDVPIFAQDISAWAPVGFQEPDGGGFDDTPVFHPNLPADQWFGDLRNVLARLGPLDGELAVTAKAILTWHFTHGYCAKCGAASEITMAGWQRDCPDCGTRHFPRTDPVVIMLITHGNDVLLGRSPGWPEGMYSLLAGFVEPGETLEAAVRREVLEETNITVGAVSYLASQPWPFPASLMVGCRGVALSTEITIDPVEIEHALWLSREDLLQVFAGQNPDITPARPGSIAHFLLQNWLADQLA